MKLTDLLSRHYDPHGVSLAGSLSMQVIPAPKPYKLTMQDVAQAAAPFRGLPDFINQWRLKNQWRVYTAALKVLVAQRMGFPVLYSRLYLTVIRKSGNVEEYGLASMRVVTTAGVNFLVDALQGTVEPELLNFHGIGTGTNAEAAGDTALQTELTTQYTTNNTRATGTQGEGASANIYRTTGVNSVDASVAITEHGVLSASAVGSGTLLDRSVFSVVNLSSGDSLSTQYDLTLSSGG